MIMAIIVVMIMITLLLLIILINNNINNNGNVIKSQVIWLKKYFLRLCLKVFKLSVFFNVSGIWFQNEGPIKDKAFSSVFVFRKNCLSFKKLFLKLVFGCKFKNFIQVVRIIVIDKFKHDWNNTLFKPINDCNQSKSLNSLWDMADILANWKQKQIHLFCIAWSFFFSFCVKFGYHHGVIRIIVVTPELKTDFFYIKTLILDLFF